MPQRLGVRASVARQHPTVKMRLFGGASLLALSFALPVAGSVLLPGEAQAQGVCQHKGGGTGGSTAVGTDSFACGFRNTSNSTLGGAESAKDSAVAIGVDNFALSNDTTAVGNQNAALGPFSTAVGDA
ncbi:MAG: hypothetical protein ACREUF_08325, partial [Solimonas sp.]